MLRMIELEKRQFDVLVLLSVALFVMMLVITCVFRS